MQPYALVSLTRSLFSPMHCNDKENLLKGNDPTHSFSQLMFDLLFTLLTFARTLFFNEFDMDRYIPMLKRL